MALMDKLKGEFVDIIEWNEEDTNTIVWRFPRFQDEIKQGAQLTVRPGQSAVFVNEGEVADVFGPGRVLLETRNLPVLSTLKGWKYGFDSPFKAEVYFVSTRQYTDLKWGTKNPVILRDADLGPVRLRAFGSFVIQAADPRMLIERMVGSHRRFQLEDIRDQLRNVVVSHFSDLLGSAGIPVLDLASRYTELSEKLSRHIAPDFAQLGFETTQVFIENISLPEEVEKALDKRSSIGAVGNLDAFARFQAATALEAAARNPSGGAGAVLGMGVGLGLAGQVTSPALPISPSIANVPPPLPGKDWWVALSGQSTGPYEVESLATMIAEGTIQPATLSWKQGQAAWVPAGNQAELQLLFTVKSG